MKHLGRAVAVLLAVLGAVFVLPRLIPVTESIEGFGFYARNDAGNAVEWASLPVKYVDSSICGTCHQDNGKAWQTSKHSTVACENCHGPAKTHIDSGVKLTVDRTRESCGTCHAKVLARPVSFPQVDPATHGGTSSCVTCHSPHSPAKPSGGAALPTIPHTLDGRADCLLCHNTGSIKPFPADHSGRAPATCLSCHKGK